MSKKCALYFGGLRATTQWWVRLEMTICMVWKGPTDFTATPATTCLLEVLETMRSLAAAGMTPISGIQEMATTP